MFILLLICLGSLLITLESSNDLSFVYNRFPAANLTLFGIAEFTSQRLLCLTNDTVQHKGQAFYPNPIAFKKTPNGTVSSFSTSFVFAIIPPYYNLGGHGLAFVISPTRGISGSLPSSYLGLFNTSNNGNFTNHVFAVELDTIKNSEFYDINDNHVGINTNGLISLSGKFVNLTLVSGKPMQAWVDYDGHGKRISVTLAPVNVARPKKPLISFPHDLSEILQDSMFIGFSSATGSIFTRHYILGWSFKMNGQAEALTISPLPKLPRIGGQPQISGSSNILIIGLVVSCVTRIVYFIKRQRKFAEVLEDWEVDYGPHRFKFKDLYVATKGFRAKEELGRGGFGVVFKGVLPKSKTEVAVKRVAHDSRQGMKEFVAEIVSIGRLRHRNVVSLLGYCRRKGELFLVYEYMPNRSLDKYLFDQKKPGMKWCMRFKVIKGVASGLFYLHEEWEQIVIHRDVKASNVMIDGEWNGRLGDFGLARLYDHGSNPQTTHVAGTVGYLAPELARTGKATTSSDVYAFGAFLLEVTCGRPPIDLTKPTAQVILVDWVFSCLVNDEILAARDPHLDSEFIGEEVELVLKLGLMCSHSDPEFRPNMQQVQQILKGELPLPNMSSMGLSISSVGLSFAGQESHTGPIFPYASTIQSSINLSSTEGSLVYGGR
ncbi:L-type lectin-domain containing receptor kinase IV.2 [Linum perenne]